MVRLNWPPMQPFLIGIIGAGNISGIYLQNAARFGYRVVALADLDLERAQAKAAEYGVALACSVPELLANPDIALVLNLTIPAAHAGISRAALEAGKHVYSEKPLATSSSEASALVALAAAKGLRLGCAPDTFLGAGYQAARQALAQIGTAVHASAAMLSSGPEAWHPDPAFFFQPGAGPLFDMGPYYLTALVALFGPIASVSASSKSTLAERTIGSGPKQGQTIAVTTPSHVVGLLTFVNGFSASLVMSFDCQAGSLPPIEVSGSQGALTLPDPNTFGGPLHLKSGKDWQEIELAQPWSDNSRGLGLLDMIESLEHNTPHRASAELALHVVEVMEALLLAAASGNRMTIQSQPTQPSPR
jgi:predicted dehydrogenase